MYISSFSYLFNLSLKKYSNSKYYMKFFNKLSTKFLCFNLILVDRFVWGNRNAASGHFVYFFFLSLHFTVRSIYNIFIKRTIGKIVLIQSLVAFLYHFRTYTCYWKLVFIYCGFWLLSPCNLFGQHSLRNCKYI